MGRVKPRVKVPKTAKAGETVTIKSLISHPMESGHRKDRATGELVPRKIINRFQVTFNGEEVIDVEMGTAVAANPYFQFDMVVPGAGTIRFEWIDDDGTVYDLEKTIAIS